MLRSEQGVGGFSLARREAFRPIYPRVLDGPHGGLVRSVHEGHRERLRHGSGRCVRSEKLAL